MAKVVITAEMEQSSNPSAKQIRSTDAKVDDSKITGDGLGRFGCRPDDTNSNNAPEMKNAGTEEKKKRQLG